MQQAQINAERAWSKREKEREIGRSSTFELDRDKPDRVTGRSAAAILMRMGSIADVDNETAIATRAFIEKVASRYDLAGAILFGSRARKSHRSDSDADVAVLLRGRPGKFVATKLAMADLAYDVLLQTGIRIQPLPIWEDEWEHPDAYSNPRLLRNIDRDGIRF